MLRKNKRAMVAILWVLLVSVLTASALAAPSGAAQWVTKKTGYADRFCGGMAYEGGCPKRTMEADCTDEQIAICKKAKEDQEAAYQDYLGKLVGAGILAQGELDAYNRVQDQRKIAIGIDMMQWTMEKVMVFRAALAKSGAELQSVLEIFVTESLLTREQAAALAAISAGGIDFNKWTVEDVKVLKSALTTVGGNRLETVQNFVTDGLLSQDEADALISREVGRIGKTRGLTAEQKDAIGAAAKEYQKACQEIAERMQAAGLCDGCRYGKGEKQYHKPSMGNDKGYKRK